MSPSKFEMFLIVSLKLFGIPLGNSYPELGTLDIKFRFICGERDMY